MSGRVRPPTELFDGAGELSGSANHNSARIATEADARPAETVQLQRIGVWEAIRWHWIVFLIPVILFTAAGVALGLNREPEYTAEAKLAISENVGGPAGLAGFAANSQSLAAGFSQGVDARGVVDPVSRKLGLTSGEVRAQVSASATAQSPVVRVQATGATEREAVRLANRSAVALRDYLEEISKSGAVEARLLDDYREAVLRVTRSTKELNRLERAGAGQALLDEARATLRADELVADGAKNAYQTRQANGAALSDLEILSPAAAATSDRIPKLQLLTFIGLAVGVAVGAALASVRARV